MSNISHPPCKSVFVILPFAIVLLLATMARPDLLCSQNNTGMAALFCDNDRTIGALVDLIAGIVLMTVAYYTTKVAASTRSRRVLLTACAFAVLATGTVGAGIAKLHADGGNVAAFSSTASAIISSLMLVAALHVFEDKNIKRHPWAMTILTVVTTTLALVGFTMFGSSLPPFIAGQRMTLLGTAPWPLAAIGFVLVAVFHYRLCLKLHSRITYWFVIGYALLALASLAVFFNRGSGDALVWVFRLSRLAASLAFLRAITLKH
ncbi:MAG: hypothetical protein AABY13_03755 [Nanoarchaeota archaeon]